MNKETKEALQREQGMFKKRYGVNYHTEEVWLAILTERVGKISQDILDNARKPNKDTFKRVMMCAAVCTTWLDSYEEERT